MAALLAYVLTVLPLPPFSVWLEDYRAHRFEHTLVRLHHPTQGVKVPPVAAEHRTVRHRSRRWNARLELFKDGGRWRGYIAFDSSRGVSAPRSADQHSEEGSADRKTRASAGAPSDSLRTANIFVDRDPAVIRARFRQYHEETLRGFLRSVLP